MSPTQCTLKWLAREGWTADVVERFIPGAKIRKDAFGFGDILAFRADQTALIQCTSASNHSSRVKKVNVSSAATGWLGGRDRIILVLSWKKGDNQEPHKITRWPK